MKPLTIVSGLVLATVFFLDSSVHSESSVRQSKDIPIRDEARTKPETATEVKDASKPSVKFSNSSLPLHVTGRNKEYIGEGHDLFKEFLQSLYVDRTFNSSFALNIPLFTLTIPGYGRGVKTQTALSALNVGNLAVLGIVVLGGLALVAPLIFPEPYKRSLSDHILPLLTEERQLQKFLTSGLSGVSESVMGWVEKSVDDLPSFPRLDGQECLKRCICEAHSHPKKYGLSGLIIQLFFPPYTEGSDVPKRIVSKYQMAARYGRQDNSNCAAQYDGCMVNLLDALAGVFKFFH
ncbi:hypothetical protein HDE_09889 [Halotydeus destructor]|nr:hypothetical protein HDE_09889 [Halotydeus destructor]